MEEMTPPEIKKHVEDYVERTCKTKVVHSKPEHKYSELGHEITIWNVKTETDGSWWVAQGDLPMNLYSQDKPYYFATDEVFSFHIGIMSRLISRDGNQPRSMVEYETGGANIPESIMRKLILGTEKLQAAVEIEEIPNIGVICRETLIELIAYLYEFDTFEGAETFKKSDVKNRGELVIAKYLSGPENSDYRKPIKDLLNGAWDYANKVTHSSTGTICEASICLTMTKAVVATFENLAQKYHDPIVGIRCTKCGSKSLSVIEHGKVNELLIICDNCGHEFSVPET